MEQKNGRKGKWMPEIKKIPISRIIITGDNPRQEFDVESLRSLGESIKTYGLLQPILVRPQGNRYELVVGERRLRASELVGLTEIEARIEDLDVATSMELRLIENTQREDLTNAEKGDAVYALWEEFPEKYPTIKSIAEVINTPYGTVQNWCSKSRKLSEYVKELIARDKLTERAAQSLLKCDHNTQDKLASAIVKFNIRGGRQGVERKFIQLYDDNPETDLRELAEKAKGIQIVQIPVEKLSEKARREVEQVLEERKKETIEARKRAIKKAAKAPRRARPKITKQSGFSMKEVKPLESIETIKGKPVTLELEEVPREAILRSAEAIIERLDEIKHPYQRDRMVNVIPKELEKLEKRLENAPERRERVEHKLNRLYELKAEGVFLSTLWDIGERAEYAGSKDFHGNCPPQVVEQCVLRLTKKGDVVLDPMAGSGTAMDVCNQLDRRCIAYDNKPPKWRNDIIRNDSRKIPLDDNSVDMIFLHPPYWDMVHYTKDEDEEKIADLSRASTLEEFLNMLKAVLLECFRVLRPNKYLCILLGDRIKDGNFIPLCRKTANLSEEVGFTDCGYAVKFTNGATSLMVKGQMIYAELAYTENLKVEHDLAMFFRKKE